MQDEHVGFARVGGLLTGGELDESVVRFAAAVARRSRTDSLGFLAAPELAEDGAVAGDDLVREWVTREGGDVLARRTEIERHPDTDFDHVLRATSARSLDLLVVGRRLPGAQLHASGIHHRLARKVPCSMLVVSRHSRPRFQRLVVSLDFSPHAALAVRTALALDDAVDDDRVVCVHVLTVPYGYSYAARSAGEYEAELRKQATESYQRFLDEHRFPADRLEIIFTVSDRAAHAVAEVAQARGADMVLVGSRGHSRAAAILVGSTTDALLGTCAAPLLVVKRKGETAGLLSALLGI